MTATCTDPQYNWMFNHLGQSPCEIAYALSNACNTGSDVNPWTLSPGQQYPVLPANDANPCTCSTVWYALIVACSACQSRSYLGFKALSQNCGTTYAEQFPRPIPDGTAVPHFAYLPLYQGDQFNWDAVPDYDYGIPDSTPVPAATTSKPQSSPSTSAHVSQTTPQGQTTTVVNQNSVTITGNGASSSAESTKMTVSTIAANGTTTIITYNGGVQTLPTSSGSSGSPQSTSGIGASQSEATTAKSSSKIGPIIGGVIGGVVLVCLCAVLVFILWRRRKGHRVEEEETRLRPAPLMAQYNNDDSAEPPPYMILDDVTMGTTNPSQSTSGPITKPAHRAINTTEPSEGVSGNQPLSKSRVHPSDHSRTASESRSGSEYV